MSETFRWWLVLLLAGAALSPLCVALFRCLPDRGYALSKPFGLLLLGYTFWLLNSLRILPNSRGGIIAALLPLIALSALFAYRDRDDLLAWGRENWRYIAGVEVLFLLVFAVAVWLRSTVGQISGTEQPMDLMFLNSVTRAENFPPKDPWLAGHDVAYYYFGYLLVGVVGKVAGVPPDIGYNVGLGMIAAMALIGAAGIVYNLVAMREAVMEDKQGAAAAKPQRQEMQVQKPQKQRRSRRAVAPGELGALTVPPPGENRPDWLANFNWRPPAFGIAGGLILVVMGNLVWVLTFASAYGIGGDGFYSWVDVARDPNAPGSGLTGGEIRHAWYPAEFFEFFSASRIYPVNNDGFRAITEFPMFSFVLGDLHPHVMALPFVLLAVAAALTLYRSTEPLDITFWLQRPLLLLGVAVIVGSLAFLNAWDIATMAFVIVAAAAISNFTRTRGFTTDLVVQIVSFAVPMLLLAVVLYVPFYAGFTSQADGIGAVVTKNGVTVAATRPFHLFLFWGPLFVMVVPFVAARLLAMRDRITATLALIAVAPTMLVVVGWALLFLYQKATDSDKLGTGTGNLFNQIGDRGTAWLTTAFVGAVLASALLALWLELTSDDEREERAAPIFGLGLTATAMLLILGCEFFYVGDVFNVRMNTVFKLYYQAWLLLAVGAGFALYYLASTWRLSFPEERAYRYAWAGATVLVLAGAALYPLGATYNRTKPYNADGSEVTVGGELDGLAHFNPEEQVAIDWLNERSQGQNFVIAEAVGNDYTLAARISAATGLPTILGWKGHEDQWRGGACAPCAGRFEDVNLLYSTADVNQTMAILRKYGVTYVYVGPLEREQYGAAGDLTKFEQMRLSVGYQSPNGAVTIYATNLSGEVSAP